MHDPERGPLVRQAFEDFATGRFTKQEVIARVTEAGLRSRKGLTASPQSFGKLMRNPLYVGQDREPGLRRVDARRLRAAVDEATFYRAQAVLDGRVVVSGPRQRNHPDFPLRGFVRCETCGRPLTGSWSKGRNGRYAYYHCQRQCRAVNVSKAALEGAVRRRTRAAAADGRLHAPGQGSDSLRLGTAQGRGQGPAAEQEKRVKAIQQKLDRLDDAFLFAQSIDVDELRTATRQAARGTDARADRPPRRAIDELDVQGILAFAERILPRASDLWVQASLDYKQRLQQLFFPEGIAFDGNRFNRTAVTVTTFQYLARSERDENLVDLTGIEPVTS